MRPTAIFSRAVISYRMKSWKMTPISWHKILNIVFAQVYAIQKNAASGRIVKPGNQFDNGGLSLPVLADQRDTLARLQTKIQAVKHQPLRSRILEGNIRNSNPRGWGAAQAVRSASSYRRLHLEERQQICQEKGLVGNARKSRENLRNVIWRIHDDLRQEYKVAERQYTPLTVL